MGYKAIAAVMMCLVLVGCQTCPPKPPQVVEVPVWTPPQVQVPDRPVMRGSTADLTTVKTLELDFLDVTEYSIKLERLIDTILNYKPASVK